MSGPRTRPTGADLRAFLDALDPMRRAEASALIPMMQSLTGEPPRSWGPSIVGFGSYHYRYPSGREGDWFLVLARLIQRSIAMLRERHGGSRISSQERSGPS